MKHESVFKLSESHCNPGYDFMRNLNSVLTKEYRQISNLGTFLQPAMQSYFKNLLISEECLICKAYILAKCNKHGVYANFTSPKSRIGLQVARKIASCANCHQDFEFQLLQCTYARYVVIC